MGSIGSSVSEFDGTPVHSCVAMPITWRQAEAPRGQYPQPPDVDLASGQVILKRAVLHIADLQIPSAAPRLGRLMGLRGVLWVPTLREEAT